MKIAIDGPAASGKSAVAREVSRRLGIPYLESGLAYRAFGYLILKRKGEVTKVSWEDLKPLFGLVELVPRVGSTEVRVEGKKVEEYVATEEVGGVASLIGAVPEFREEINRYFRKVIGDSQIVVEGRDAGTHIIPEAELKIFLTASPEERARRRVNQLREKGVEADYGEILRRILERDRRDMEREKYPFRPAEDAIVIDTTGRSVEEVVEEVIALARHTK
ncbi:MAG: (d)CMP kinase [Aquificota bacterium]|nr:(d)CMP kinase [Aquificota bacterium]